MSVHDDDAELDALAARLRRSSREALTAPPAPPTELRERTLAAVSRDAQSEVDRPEPASRARRFPSPRLPRLAPWLVAGAAVAAVLVALAIALPFGGDGGPPGTLELDATLRGPGGAASIQVRMIPSGRTVDLDSSSLAILPEGAFYELWFVGPGDTRSRPNRISAGTFHPDDKGRSHVLLKAAADPKKFPTIEVTAEPGDGNPRATGPVEIRTRR